jgi:hypothetical protein
VFPGVSSILEDLRIRALSASIEDFTVAAGFSGLDPNTIITGAFTSGSAGWGFSVGIVSGSLALGPSAYLYQLQDKTGPKYKIGTFVNVRASAQVGISQTGVGADGYAKLPSADFVTEASKVQTLSDLQEISTKGEFELGGTLRLAGCASALIGHCAAGISFAAAYPAIPDSIFAARTFAATVEREVVAGWGNAATRVAKTLYIGSASPWEHGCCENFNGKLRDEYLNGEVLYSLREAHVVVEQ